MPNSDHQITLSIDAEYNYHYSGGNKGNGNVENKTGQGQSKIHLTLETNGYEFVDLHFTGDGQNNFSYKHNGSKKITIDDSCDSNADVKYTANVVQTATGRNVACDPRVVNN